MRRQGQARRLQIGGRKPELPPQPIPPNHRARQRIGAPQHLAGLVQIAAPNRFPDARAAHRPPAERHRRHPMHREAQLPPQLAQQLHIPAPLMAENEVGPDAETLEAAQVARQFSHKGLARLFAESPVEADEQQRVRAQGLNRAQFPGRRIDQRRHPIGSHDDARLRIERDHQHDRVMMPGIREGLANDLLVPQMHAVKKTDAQADFAAGGVELARSVNDAHRGKIGQGPRPPR